jgi:hypothetical protein
VGVVGGGSRHLDGVLIHFHDDGAYSVMHRMSTNRIRNSNGTCCNNSISHDRMILITSHSIIRTRFHSILFHNRVPVAVVVIGLRVVVIHRIHSVSLTRTHNTIFVRSCASLFFLPWREMCRLKCGEACFFLVGVLFSVNQQQHWLKCSKWSLGRKRGLAETCT